MLSNSQKRHLKKLAHDKKPVILIGAKGLTDAVMTEIDQALSHHELLKIRVNAADREERQTLINRISQTLNAELVQRVGHIATFYRHNSEQNKIQLPNE